MTYSIEFLREFAPGPGSGSSTPSEKAKPNGAAYKGKAKDNKKFANTEAFIPENVYEALKGLSRFDALRVSDFTGHLTQLTSSVDNRKTLRSSSDGSSKLYMKSFSGLYPGPNLLDLLQLPAQPTKMPRKSLDLSHLQMAGSRLARNKRPMLFATPRPENQPSLACLVVRSDPSFMLPVRKTQSPLNHISLFSLTSNRQMSDPLPMPCVNSTSPRPYPNTDLVKVLSPLPSKYSSRLSHLF